MVNVRCYQMQVSYDGTNWNTLAHYYGEKSEADLDAQTTLFSMRRINPKAKTRVQSHAHSMTRETLYALKRMGIKAEEI